MWLLSFVCPRYLAAGVFLSPKKVFSNISSFLCPRYLATGVIFPPQRRIFKFWQVFLILCPHIWSSILDFGGYCYPSNKNKFLRLRQGRAHKQKHVAYVEIPWSGGKYPGISNTWKYLYKIKFYPSNTPTSHTSAWTLKNTFVFTTLGPGGLKKHVFYEGFCAWAFVPGGLNWVLEA